MIGINVSGAEFGGTGGTHNYQYHYPTLAELQFYKDHGVDLIRLPFIWERMQPSLGGPLNPTELGLLKSVLSNASNLGLDVIVDLHNFGRYNGQPIGSPDGPTQAEFADFWSKLSVELKDYPSLVGYDLMNEPHDMPAADTWKLAAQAAVDAIRLVDMDNIIYVEGNNWASAQNWLASNANLFIFDPAGKLIYQAHQYFDASGEGFYNNSYDADGAYPMIGVDRLKPFVEWLEANNLQGMIGEFGVPGNDPRWLVVQENVLQYMEAHNLDGTAWGGGTWWPTDYAMFMGAPGRADSAYFNLLEGYFGPYDEAPVPLVNVVNGTPANDVLAGTAGTDQMDGRDGNDTLLGSAGADRMTGGARIDTASYAYAPNAVDVDLSRAEQLGSDAAGDSLFGIENLTGSSLGDLLSGDALANLLSGGGGNDILNGRGGADRLDGGLGQDMASYADSPSAVNVDLARSSQQGGNAQGDVLVGIEGIVGSNFGDTLRGSAGQDVLRGGSGNDELEGRAGADALCGDAGTDTVSYAGSNAGVDVNLARTVQLGGHAIGDTLSSIENVTGSRYGDKLTGDGLGNWLSGGAGNDILDGGGGADHLAGGSGKDRFAFDTAANAQGDLVTDFLRRDDILDFSAIDANSLAAGDQGFTLIGSQGFSGVPGEMRTFQAGGNTYVSGDVNGDWVADFTVTLTGSMMLGSSNFIV